MFEGRVESTVYDTAHLALIADQYPEFNGATDYIRNSQLADGSWGSPYFHGYDRLINTVAAMVSLREGGATMDAPSIAQGEVFLQSLDISTERHDTIGFPLISTALMSHAREIGLRVPVVTSQEEVIRKKVALLGSNAASWKKASSIFSLDALLDLTSLPDNIDPTELYNRYGSVAASPAATAALLRRVPHAPAQDWLRLYQNTDGGIGDIDPIDCFELAWIAEYSTQLGHRTPSWLNELYKHWSADYGLISSSHFEIYDLDITASGFLSLYCAGFPVTTKPFERYFAGDHFLCFIGEANASLSTHARVVLALSCAEEWHGAEIARQVLINAHRSGDLWFDKWHVSPYYLRSLALRSIGDPLIEEELTNWLLTTQRPDGGWGWQGSTPEETAYALFGLHSRNRICADIGKRAADYLDAHQGELPIPLWIGKGLYTSRFLVDSIVSLARELCDFAR